MTPNKRVHLWCESFLLGAVFRILPADFPHLRELRIQNAKLQRLLSKTSPEAEGLLGSGSLKKLRKLQGRHDVKVGQQLKRVRSLTEKSFKTRLHFSNREFQQWKSHFNSVMAKHIAGMKKEGERIVRTMPPLGVLPPLKK